MIAITGATGQLGRLVIKQLLNSVPAGELIAAVRSPQRAADLAALGVTVRYADYDRPESLATAFAGVRKLLLISSSEVGQRLPQHRMVIEAAAEAEVELLAYTSILHCDRSPLLLAAEHQQTEALLRDSGLSYVLLRNGWYTENYMAAIPTALQYGQIAGCAGEGRLSSASRSDYAAAAAAVLTSPAQQAGRIYELAGDEAWTLAELAAEISVQSGIPVSFDNVAEADYRDMLVGFGLPEGFARALADSETGIANGELFDDGRQLSRLIGRPTTALSVTVTETLTTLNSGSD
ncbi:SDR family oxidoreductase [Mariprofundus erugo]|uniref:SDR family oxidoreductase n=1 Tax=Mariprofundus erugo TaxID=2528639 RepID=UPI0010FE8F63|nr:SDR family oxidoreductase [Mariprofundus erugo]TLS77972.1 SDR family oxidoreductase [Mariprofundus erugo]